MAQDTVHCWSHFIVLHVKWSNASHLRTLIDGFVDDTIRESGDSGAVAVTMVHVDCMTNVRYNLNSEWFFLSIAQFKQKGSQSATNRM